METWRSTYSYGWYYYTSGQRPKHEYWMREHKYNSRKFRARGVNRKRKFRHNRRN